VLGKLRYLYHQIPVLFRRKPKSVYALAAKVTVGTEESAAIWSERLDRRVVAGEIIDLGTISETKSKGWGVKANG
jgi:hypothetical protein